MTYQHEDGFNIKCADIDPISYRVALGDDQPSMSVYSFNEAAPTSVRCLFPKEQLNLSKLNLICYRDANNSVARFLLYAMIARMILCSLVPWEVLS
jgi:hypothetical protein